jgi:hypothetical protein
MIDRFLYYSYDPGCSRSGLTATIRDAVQRETLSGSRSELLEAGKQALKESVDREVERSPSETQHVVPLSAGLDSRTILALLLAHPDVDAREITTVSFGTPTTWDFEIGQEVAQAADVRNTAVDLTADSFDWSLSSLREYVRQRDRPVRVLEGYVIMAILEGVSSDSVIWSGFMGDPTAGGHQPTTPSDSWMGAWEHFVANNQFAERLCSADFEPTATLPNEPYLERTELSYEEQLDFAHRQQCLIVPLVISDPERYKTPFVQPEWLSFSLNLPSHHRHNRSLFKDVVLDLAPTLFSMPTDANRGVPLNAGRIREFVHRGRLFTTRKTRQTLGLGYLPPSTNYLDFARSFREPGQLRETAKTLLDDFAEREIASWLEPREIWTAHQSGDDRADQIRALCTAELVCSETELLPSTE